MYQFVFFMFPSYMYYLMRVIYYRINVYKTKLTCKSTYIILLLLLLTINNIHKYTNPNDKY